MYLTLRLHFSNRAEPRPSSGVLSGLPAGLTLSATGVLSGTPTVSGAMNITINVTDSSAIPKSATFTYAVNIAAP